MNFDQLTSDILLSKPVIPVPKPERKVRQSSSNPIDWNFVDQKVFKAALHFSFAGADIAKFIRTCPTFVKGDDDKNRKIIGDSLESLSKRGLVKLVGQGRDRYVQAANGASIVSYFNRDELPPVAIVYRRTTVTETNQETTEISEDYESDSDYDDLADDLSVE